MDSGTFKKMLIVLAQIMAAIAVIVFALVFGTPLAPRPGAVDTASRLAFAVEWLVVPAFVLLLALVLVMTQRFIDADSMDGTRTPTSRFMEINLRFAQNTLEQVVLAAVAWLGLALALPEERLALIPVLAVLFAIGRFLFWIGYQLHPLWRGVGFSMTALPNAVAIVWLAWLLVSA